MVPSAPEKTMIYKMVFVLNKFITRETNVKISETIIWF